MTAPSEREDAGAGIAEALPKYHERVLLVGKWGPRVLDAFRKRGVQAHIAAAEGDIPEPGESFDAAILGNSDAGLAALPWAAPQISPDGALYLPVERATQFLSEVADAGFVPYRPITAGNGDEVLMAVRSDYNPLLHARKLMAGSANAKALEVLTLVPEAILPNDAAKALLATETQRCYLAVARQSQDPSQLTTWFFRAQQQFYAAINGAPRLEEPYHLQATFWLELGNTDMAARILRSIERVVQNAETRLLLKACPTGVESRPEEEPVPTWSGEYHPRVLVVMHRHADCGMDALYDGLCGLLGDDRVTEYPWKAGLHGQAPDIDGSHPSLFKRGGEPKELDEVEAELRRGDYDIVLSADMLRDNDPDTIHRLMAAAEDVPVFVVDTWDDCGNHWPAICEELGRDKVSGYFKREMLTGAHYEPGTWPLPLSYPDGRVAGDIGGKRPHTVFWAGNRVFGLRRLYLEHLEDLLGRKLDARYNQEAYISALHRSRIGLNFFGFGFDTFRYWELPAHGCMLLTERPPIHIPHNFVHGESAVFFDDLPDLEQKLAYYLAHPDEATTIAAAGHSLLRKHHTASARAGQLLGRIQQALESE